MKVYFVVREDRHVDDEITAHASLELANEAVDEFTARYDAEWVEEESGWLRYLRDEHDDGPHVHVEEGELDLGPAVQVILFVEGRFVTVVQQDTRAEAVAFCKGYCLSATRHHANASLYLVPEDLPEMVEDNPAEEVERALQEAGIP